MSTSRPVCISPDRGGSLLTTGVSRWRAGSLCSRAPEGRHFHSRLSTQFADNSKCRPLRGLWHQMTPRHPRLTPGARGLPPLTGLRSNLCHVAVPNNFSQGMLCGTHPSEPGGPFHCRAAILFLAAGTSPLPGPERVRNTAREVLARPEFQVDGSTEAAEGLWAYLHRLGSAVLDLFRGLFERSIPCRPFWRGWSWRAGVDPGAAAVAYRLHALHGASPPRA